MDSELIKEVVVSLSLSSLPPLRPFPLERSQPQDEACSAEGSTAQSEKGPQAALEPAFAWPSSYMK